MNPAISGCGVEFPHEESLCGSQYRHVFTEPRVLRLELLDLLMFLRRGPGPGPVVDLGLDRPPAHCLRADPILPGHRIAGRRQRRVLAAVLTQQPQRPLLDRGIDPLWHGAILPDSESTGTKPQTIHGACEQVLGHRLGRVSHMWGEARGSLVW